MKASIKKIGVSKEEQNQVAGGEEHLDFEMRYTKPKLFEVPQPIMLACGFGSGGGSSGGGCTTGGGRYFGHCKLGSSAC